MSNNTSNNSSNNTNSYENVSGKPNPFLVTTVKGIKDMRINGANVIIDGKVFSFNETIFAYDFLFNLAHNIELASMDCENENDTIEIFLNRDYRPAAEEDLEDSISVTDAFHQAIQFVLGRGDLFYNEMPKIVSSDDPVFIFDIYELQDMLSYALQDAGADPSPEDVYAYYLADTCDLLYFRLVDFDTFLIGVKEFFDDYLPIAMESSRVTSE